MKSRLIQWEFRLTTEFKVQPHIKDMRSPCPRSLGAKSANALWQSDEIQRLPFRLGASAP